MALAHEWWFRGSVWHFMLHVGWQGKGLNPHSTSKSGGDIAIGAGLALAGLSCDPCTADAALFKVDRSMTFFGLIAARIRSLVTALAAFKIFETHPDGPDHTGKRHQFR